ncbi:hypothetical protein ACM64Y_10990 [Novispirillum sp. DQ9]|uniref:hypothetical protein n=1 Tax=Novispirillum sp. DQ9 TaxID=3398612 RepID=UPI003C7A9793
MASRPRRKAVRTDDLRADLAGRLPGRIRALLADYETFATAAAAPLEEAKGYAVHHAACKAALQHADMLVKLLRWAEGGEPEPAATTATAGGRPGDDLGRLLARARDAVTDDEEGEEEDDGT